MRSSQFNANNETLANPQPGGYWAGDLYLEDGQLVRRMTARSRFAGNLFVVDKSGKVWLGVRRIIWPGKGVSAQWFAVKIEQGRKNNWRPAPYYWREFVTASLVIPLLPETPKKARRHSVRG